MRSSLTPTLISPRSETGVKSEQAAHVLRDSIVLCSPGSRHAATSRLPNPAPNPTTEIATMRYDVKVDLGDYYGPSITVVNRARPRFANGDRPLHAMVQVEERGRAMQDVERVEQRHYAGAGCGEGVRVLGVAGVCYSRACPVRPAAGAMMF